MPWAMWNFNANERNYYIIITPRAALAEQCKACNAFPRNGQFRYALASTIHPRRGGIAPIHQNPTEAPPAHGRGALAM